ncbi:hypothetical protein SAMN04487995_1984 [Dyadobacter koreensis]|uniref:Uncharacterized protein n=1 Tax=Dyadobacter koreensis TaxID=408657 RepID=A0A1H6TDS8_9BACT|nr:hypothetical protein [Dyadobacter koreensis]SEI74395.1 hypothetical protein SAMN04487995_1984 [Dyadobacter koreensis]
MEEKDYTGTVPEKFDGGNINAERVAELHNIAAAKALFIAARKRLLDVNNWKEISKQPIAEFSLTDSNGNEVSGPVQEGMYFRIDIPGPGTKTGNGFDWVLVEKISEYQLEDIESIGIRVRPASNPKNMDQEIAHFYSPQTTSTFTITRENTKVTAAVYDRNTKANTDDLGFLDKLRNMLTGAVGILAFSKIQWESLTDGLIKDNNC